jgi:hypothetical protein
MNIIKALCQICPEREMNLSKSTLLKRRKISRLVLFPRMERELETQMGGI